MLKQYADLGKIEDKDRTDEHKLKLQKVKNALKPFKEDKKYFWKMVKEPTVEYSHRYDKHGGFIMAAPVVVPRRNNASINQFNGFETIVNEGNTDKQLCLNPGDTYVRRKSH